MFDKYREILPTYTYSGMYTAVVGETDAILEFERIYGVTVGFVYPSDTGPDVDKKVTELFALGYRFVGCSENQTNDMPISFCASAAEVSLKDMNLDVFWCNFHTQGSGRVTIPVNGKQVTEVCDTLPPARMLDNLPPPSPEYEAALARWSDFDGEW